MIFSDIPVRKTGSTIYGVYDVENAETIPNYALLLQKRRRRLRTRSSWRHAIRDIFMVFNERA